MPFGIDPGGPIFVKKIVRPMAEIALDKPQRAALQPLEAGRFQREKVALLAKVLLAREVVNILAGDDHQPKVEFPIQPG